MYQKSPFPYLITLIAIIGISCITNLTIDKEIEEPIIHVIKENTSNESFLTLEKSDLSKRNTELALAQ